MKKLLCIAFMAFGIVANAQSIESLINNNVVIKETMNNSSLTFREKIAVVNDQVQEGKLTKDQAYTVISKLTEDYDNADAVVDEEAVYADEWKDEANPFNEAMAAEVDTVANYRTASSVYVGFGVGNVATDGMFSNSEFGYIRSNSVEFGLAMRSPFSKSSNKWGVRYGIGFKYNGLATTGNNEFALSGDQTITAPSAQQLRKNYTYLRNTYITIPVTLDFTTSTKSFNMANKKFVNTTGFNFGIGGYLGYNINSKQHVRYTNANDHKIYEQQKGDWNVNDFQYGVMAYVGFEQLKLVAKYDLNPLFKNNAIDQNYWSLGIQLGL